jgi:hypothetical protein
MPQGTMKRSSLRGAKPPRRLCTFSSSPSYRFSSVSTLHQRDGVISNTTASISCLDTSSAPLRLFSHSAGITCPSPKAQDGHGVLEAGRGASGRASAWEIMLVVPTRSSMLWQQVIWSRRQRTDMMWVPIVVMRLFEFLLRY